MEWTGARYADKPTVQAQTWIDADPSAVWRIVADVELMPTMSEELQRVEWQDRATGPSVGATFVGHSRHEALGEWSTPSHIIECAEPEVLAWAVGNPANPSATWRFSLRPQDGGTELTQWMQLGPGPLRPVLCHRGDAGEGTEDRVRAAARVREGDHQYPRPDQDHGRAVLMRTATTVEASGDWAQTVDFVVGAEKLGMDVCWVAEAWGADAPSALGYLAARTERLLLGSGIIQLGTRTPVAIAQTAITLSNMSGGRFLLGLGASGPQVIEGLHGVPFARPKARMRETTEIIRQVVAGDGKISHQGAEFTIPLPGGDAVPMRTSIRADHPIPIYHASLSPAMLRLTGELADGWLGTSFVPEGAADAYFAHLDAGLAESGRTRAELDICQGAEVAFARDEDELRTMVAGRRKELAFSIGGMGSASTNYYNRAYSRQGWAQVAAEIRERWQAGDRDGATGLVTDEMVLGTTLIGTEPMVARRLRVWRDAGVDTVRFYPSGDTLDARLTTLGRALDLVRALS